MIIGLAPPGARDQGQLAIALTRNKPLFEVNLREGDLAKQSLVSMDSITPPGELRA
jgi:hypothetical protein